MRALLILALLASFSSAAELDGLTALRVEHGGRHRAAMVIAPKGKAQGIVLVLPARNGISAWRNATRRELETRAVADGFVVAYPEAVENIYNDGRGFPGFPSQAQHVDDASFIWALADLLEQKHGIKGGPVYAVGFGAGAFMVQRLVCENNGRLKGAVAVAGTLARPLRQACAQAQPVPVMLVAGDADPFNDWKSGVVHIGGIKQGRMLSPERTMALWGKNFQCGAPKKHLLPDTDPADETRTLLTQWSGCRDGARIHLYTVRGGGFGWPGGEPVDLEIVFGPRGMDFDASRAAWDFLRGR